MQKTILITGCSSGIGAALAAELGRRGHRVYATARRSETLASLERDGIRGLELDVNDDMSIARAFETVAAESRVARAASGPRSPPNSVGVDTVFMPPRVAARRSPRWSVTAFAASSST